MFHNASLLKTQLHSLNRTTCCCFMWRYEHLSHAANYNCKLLMMTHTQFPRNEHVRPTHGFELLSADWITV